MTHIQFVGNRKTGQVQYRGGSIFCKLDSPTSCLLEIGFDVTEHDAKTMLRDHGDIFKETTPEAFAVAMAPIIPVEVEPLLDPVGDLSDLTITELRTLAKGEGIDLGKARVKAKIIKILQAAGL